MKREENTNLWFCRKGEDRQIIQEDLYDYNVPSAVLGHNGDNEGSILEEHPHITEFRFGPCLIEAIPITTVLANITPARASQVVASTLLDATALRYTMLDGQQIVAIMSSNHPTFLCQMAHASFSSQLGKGWRDHFPADLEE